MLPEAHHVQPDRSLRPLVVADIGGTNARFGFLGPADALPVAVRTLPTAEHEGPLQAMQAYLKGLPPELQGAAATGLSASWALATTVGGDEVVMTNNHWRFSRQAVQQALGLKALHLFNDFEALAYAVPHLGPQQLQSWDDRLPRLDGTLAVIGPGTGLGVAGVARTRAGWQALPGEGGHVTLSAANDDEAELLRLARRQWPHVSAERLLSGIGLPLLHDCVAQQHGRPGPSLSTEAVVQAGLAGDPVAARTLDTFCAMLGSFSGNVALTLGARGGVFLGGGILPRLGPLFFRSAFRQRFEDKGRFAAFLAGIPTVVITDTMVALSGAEKAAQACAG